MLEFTLDSDFPDTRRWLNRIMRDEVMSVLRQYGQQGVSALAAATPQDTGDTAEGWSYKVRRTRSGYSLEWYNSNVESGVPIAILIQYGHATGTGGYVEGRDFINPALQPIFDQIASEAWRVVNSV